MKFEDDISNMNTHKHTHTHMDKPKPICPPLFQSWGHKNSTLIVGGRSLILFMSLCYRLQFKVVRIRQESQIRPTPWGLLMYLKT